MSRRNFVGLSAKGTQNKKSRDSFNLEWLKVKVTTGTPDFKNIKVELSLIYEYSFENGLKCKICAACSSFETNTANEYATGKRWEAWKLDYCKRHLLSRIHAKNVQILYNQKHGISVKSLLTEKLADRTAHLDQAKCLQTNEEEIRILNGNVLLAIIMNASMLCVKTIHDHIGKYISLPDSWRSKNYRFEFVTAINKVVPNKIFTKLRASLFHTLIVDESTDIVVHKVLVLYFKYRSPNSLVYKTMFGGIIQLTECHAQALKKVIKRFYIEHEIYLNRLVMLTSDGAAVMLGRWNGLAALLKRTVPHLSEQHCVAHRKDFALTASWKDNNLLKNIEVLLRTVYTLK